MKEAQDLVRLAKEIMAKLPKHVWMKQMEDTVTKEIPDVAMKRPQDYWDTATYLYSKGSTPEEAAQKMIDSIKHHRASSKVAWDKRFNFPRSFYIPKDAPNLKQLDEGKDLDLEFWSYEDAKGGIYGMAFWGKANKPLWHYRFRDMSQFEKKVRETIDSRKSHVDRVEQRRQERVQYKHNLKVGDILISSWGYDQTNATWFQVVDVGEKSVQVREIAGKSVAEDKEVASPGHFTGPVMTKVVRQGDSVRVNSYSNAYKWDGNPEYVTPFGMGH